LSARILITGASSGIGRAIALELAGPESELILTGRDLPALQDVSESAMAKGAQVSKHYLELSSEMDVVAFGEKIASEKIELDVVINNAAVIKLGNIITSQIADLDWHHAVNLKAPLILTKCLLRSVQLARGQFVFINSMAGLVARKGVAFYAATKHGLKAIADSLREEVQADGVTVLSVFLGRANTPMQARVLEMENATADLSAFLQPEYAAELIAQAMKRCRSGKIANLTIRAGEEPHFW
jgi:short-subunit dehydrogenase